MWFCTVGGKRGMWVRFETRWMCSCRRVCGSRCGVRVVPIVVFIVVVIIMIVTTRRVSNFRPSGPKEKHQRNQGGCAYGNPFPGKHFPITTHRRFVVP